MKRIRNFLNFLTLRVAMLCGAFCIVAPIMRAQNATTPLQLAQQAQLAGKWDDAIAQFSVLLKTEPLNVNALVGLGFSHFKLGDLDDAQNFYERALKINSRHVGAGYGLGQIAIERKNWPVAATWFGDILRIAPQFEPVRTRHNLALALRAQNKIADANQIFAQALNQPSENLYPQLFRDAVDNAIAQTDFPTAQEWSQRATTQFPNNAWLWDDLGWTWLQLHRRRSAHEAYDRAAALAYPNSSPQNSTVLSLPFRGAWRVLQGNASFDTHQGLGARFAWDFVAPNHSFGQEVLAPAAGRVVDLKDGTPDNAPGHRDPSPHSGNYIVIEHATGEWSVLAHLENGSLAVKIGQEVQRGQNIARCGNSGHSEQSHLHFSFLKSFDGERISQPAQFSKYLQRDGETKTAIENGVPQENQIVENQPPKTDK